MVVGRDKKWSIDWAIAELLRAGRDQERSGEWKEMPRTVPEVVGPKDLSKLGQGGESLT